LRRNMLQKNLETMVVNILNYDGSRKWDVMDGSADGYTTTGADANGSCYTEIGTSTTVAVADRSATDLGLVFDTGVLTQAIIPIAPRVSASVNKPIFRANLNLNFDVHDDVTKTVLDDQEDGTVDIFMVGINVAVSDDFISFT